MSPLLSKVLHVLRSSLAPHLQVPTLLFGELLTSDNYDDTEKKVTGGRNGYGAKLTNIFSKKFILETADSKRGLKFKQTWENNMSVKTEPEIEPYSGKDYTCVTFWPDLPRFNMEKLDDDIVDFMTKRVYDIAGTSQRGKKEGIKVRRNPLKTHQQSQILIVLNSFRPTKIIEISTEER